MIIMALFVAIGFSAHTSGGKDLRVVVFTTNPEMHCQSCEKKIKENIRFEAGVQKIETSLEKQQVTITYNPSKTDESTLQKAIEKLGYSVQKVQ